MTSCVHVFSTLRYFELIPYSRKFSLGANFQNFCTQTCFCGNKNELRWRLIKALCAHRCERDDSLQSVCSRNSHCREESACYHTKCQQIRKRGSEVVKVEISSAKFFCSTSQFLPHDSSPDAFVIVRASTQKRKTRFLLHKLASSLRCSVSLFLVRMWDVVIN